LRRLGIRLVLLGAAVAVRSGAALPGVVGRVEAGALEVDGHGMEDPLHRCAALLAGRDGIVRHRLEDLEGVAFGAAVLVDRHPPSIMGLPRAPPWDARPPGGAKPI